MLAAQQYHHSLHQPVSKPRADPPPNPPVDGDSHSTNHKKNLQSTISIHPVVTSTLPAYRRLIANLLPIRYPDKFYKESVSDPLESYSVALCATQHCTPPLNGKRKRDTVDSGAGPNVVAGIQARLEILPPSPPTSPTNPPEVARAEYQLYIQTLATASPNRRLSLATHLLHELISTAITAHPNKRITSVYAHVWEANEDALSWYLNRGFSVDGGIIQGYYRRLRPGGARVLRRGIGVNEYLEARKMEQVCASLSREALADEVPHSLITPKLDDQADSETEKRKVDQKDAEDVREPDVAEFRDTAQAAMG